MNILSIDIETYSDQDITKVGAYRYVDTLEFEILLFAYAYDDEPVKIIDLAMGETIPDKIIKDLHNPNVIKSAFNANFERTALGEYFGYMSLGNILSLKILPTNSRDKTDPDAVSNQLLHRCRFIGLILIIEFDFVSI